MIQIKHGLLKSKNVHLFSAEAFVKLFQRDKDAIESARFIPPKIGSNSIAGHVQVRFKTRLKHESKPCSTR